MKSLRSFQIGLFAMALIPNHPVRSEVIDFSWWDDRYAIPGLYSGAGGGYTRDARLPDEDPISESSNDFSSKTNQEPARVRVFPPGSDIIDPNVFTARAQSDFGQNHAETRTIITGYGESENRQFFDDRSHSMQAESIWADQWTFSGAGVGSGTVALSASFEVDFSNSPCSTGDCGQVSNPVFTRQGLRTWWYRVFGSIRVFDLDQLDTLLQQDSDSIDVPREVASFGVFQQGANEDRDFFSPIEPFTVLPNSRLTPIHSSGVASFVPLAGHRYAVIGQVNIQSREGSDVDASHTLSLNQVLVGQGLRLNSVASTNGAQFKIRADTPLTISRSANNVMTLSFPSAAGFTYIVEIKNPLLAADWTPFATRVGNGTVQSVTDSNTGESSRLYRLRVQ